MHEPTDPVQAQRIDLTRETDVAYWCRIFDVSIDELREAVQHTGPDVREVQRHLQNRAAGPGTPR
jgi:hypothetical protein